MADRHKRAPRPVRMSAGLEAWYKQRAADAGLPLNAVIVAALEDYRSRRGGDTTAAPAPDAVAPRPARSEPAALADCPHPAARINKGLCGACGTYVGK